MVSPSIAPGTLKPVRIPFRSIAPMVDTLPPWSPGTESWTRSPGAARPYRRDHAKLPPPPAQQKHGQSREDVPHFPNWGGWFFCPPVGTGLFFYGGSAGL